MSKVQTHIDRVTLYRNGALVVRTGDAGAGSVVVEDLPLLYASDALRVRAARGLVHDVDELVAVTGQATPPVEDEARRTAQRLDQAKLTDEIARLEGELLALASLAPALPSTSDRETARPAVEAWLGAVKDAEDLATIRTRALFEAKRALAALHDELRVTSATGRGDETPPRFLRGLSFRLDEACAFEIEYFVAAARWFPTYTLHVDGKRARLALAALVAQASGEDWEGARVLVSTADLARDTSMPELASWRMGRAQPPVRKGFRPLPEGLEALFHGYDAARPSPGTPPPPPRAAPRAAREVAVDLDAERGARDAPMEAKHEEAYFDGDDDSATGEYAANALEDALADATEARTMAGSLPPPAAMAPTLDAAAPARARAAPAMAKRTGAPGGGGAAPAPRRPPRALPPRLRYGAMRLRGPDERGRGTLVGLDVVEQLAWFVEAHDVNLVSELRRAVDALAVAGTRLTHSPLPPGAMSLDDDHVPHTFAAEGRHRVPCDGSYWRVEVMRVEGPARLEVRGVPRESEDLYRFCLVDTKGEVPLPRGPLAVYEDGLFRVNARLDAHGGGGPIELCLGVEDELRVVGRVAETHQEEKGLTGATSRVTQSVTVKVRSTASVHRDVVLFERLPVAAKDERDLTVALVDAKPPPHVQGRGPDGHELLGGLTFRLVVQGGATDEVRFRYTIDLPAKRELVGGNRRE